MRYILLIRTTKGDDLKMLKIINFKELSKMNDEKLLKLTNKVYQLALTEQVSEVALNYFINEVSKRHYGFEDVTAFKPTDEYLCFNKDNFIKVVKKQSAMKFIAFDIFGSALPIVAIRSIQNDDKGNIFLFA